MERCIDGAPRVPPETADQSPQCGLVAEEIIKQHRHAPYLPLESAQSPGVERTAGPGVERTAARIRSSRQTKTERGIVERRDEAGKPRKIPMWVTYPRIRLLHRIGRPRHDLLAILGGKGPICQGCSKHEIDPCAVDFGPEHERHVVIIEPDVLSVIADNRKMPRGY